MAPPPAQHRLAGRARPDDQPIVEGWINYYGRFYRSRDPLLRRINAYLVRWAGKKYKRLKTFKRARAWWKAVTQREPLLFAQWRWVHSFW